MGNAATELEQRVLILAPTARDGDITCSLLLRAGVPCHLCRGLDALAREVEAGAGALLLTEEVLGADGVKHLVSALENQPPWSAVPVVLLMSSAAQTPAAARMLEALGNVTLVERPAAMRSLVSAVQAALRGRARQYETRAHILALKEAEARSRELQEQFQAMANSIPQLAWMAKPDGWIFWYNRRWHEYCGSTPEQMEGWGWQSVHDPNELPRVIEKWKLAVAAGTAWEDTFPLRRHDGEFRWHLSRAMPFSDAAGQVVLWFGTNTDVSDDRDRAEERERVLQAERAARNESERAGRMKDEFLATLSHELRTPLNAILGWAQILRSGSRDEGDLAEGLKTIERNARAQTQIIEDLLDMSRIISGKVRLDVQRVDLAAVVGEAVATAKPSADAKDIRLQPVLDPHAGPVSGDPNRLQQVFWNLLSNAVKFTPKGGRVQVLLERVNSHVEVSVIDTGEGIAPGFLPHVFDRFRQADATTTRRHGGLGLGLSIVKQLVELHGGTVRVKSPGKGQGSTFVVALPLTVVHPEPTPELVRRHPHAEAVSGHQDPCDDLAGMTILVVDDEPDARALMTRFLEDCKAKVVTAASAEEALERVRADRPDVIASDIGMPGMDGYEMIRRVRAMPPDQGGDTPAVALTAYARVEDRVQAVRAGFQHHVAKPVEPAELIAMIASLAERPR